MVVVLRPTVSAVGQDDAHALLLCFRGREGAGGAAPTGDEEVEQHVLVTAHRKAHRVAPAGAEPRCEVGAEVDLEGDVFHRR